MRTIRGDLPGLPAGEQSAVERLFNKAVVADTFAGRIHVECDAAEVVTPFDNYCLIAMLIYQAGYHFIARDVPGPQGREHVPFPTYRAPAAPTASRSSWRPTLGARGAICASR